MGVTPQPDSRLRACRPRAEEHDGFGQGWASPRETDHFVDGGLPGLQRHHSSARRAQGAVFGGQLRDVNPLYARKRHGSDRGFGRREDSGAQPWIWRTAPRGSRRCRSLAIASRISRA